MELRLPLEVFPGRQATCRAVFGTWGSFPDDARASHCPFVLTSFTGWSSKRCPGIGFLSRGDRLENLGFISNAEGDVPVARAQLEESVSLAREVGDPWLLAFCLVRLASAVERTDMAAGRQIREEGVAVARSVGDRSILSEGLGDLAPFYQLEGNLSAAESVAEEALAAAREIRDFIHEMISLLLLVITACLQDDLMKAKRYCFQALAVARETGASQWLLLVIFAFGYVAVFSGQPRRGVRLCAAAITLVRQRGFNLFEGGGGPG